MTKLKLLFLINRPLLVNSIIHIFKLYNESEDIEYYVLFKHVNDYNRLTEYSKYKIPSEFVIFGNIFKNIKNICPDAVIVLSKRINHDIMQFCKIRNILRVYFPHGITVSDNSLVKRLRKRVHNYFNECFDLVFFNSFSEIKLLKKKFNSNIFKYKMCHIGGSFNMDGIFNMDKNKICENKDKMMPNTDTKTIMLVHSCDSNNSDKEFIIIATLLIKLSNKFGFKLIIRTKLDPTKEGYCCIWKKSNNDGKYSRMVNKIYSNKNVIKSTKSSCNFYDLLFVDLIIVHGYSTASYESLIYTPATIFCRILNKIDPYITDDKMLIVNTIPILKKYIKKFMINKTGGIITKKYLKARSNFIKELFPNIGKCKDVFIENIVSNIKLLNNNIS